MEHLKTWWRGISKAETEKADVVLPETDKREEISEKQTQALLNKTNNSQVTKESKVTPVLVDQTNINVVEKFRRYIQENTYLQPEDCFSCKLIATGVITFSLATLLLADIRVSLKYNVPKSRMRISKAAVCTVWALFIYREWYNCLFTPPGEKPRSLVEYEITRIEKIRKYFE